MWANSSETHRTVRCPGANRYHSLLWFKGAKPRNSYSRLERGYLRRTVICSGNANWDEGGNRVNRYKSLDAFSPISCSARLPERNQVGFPHSLY